MSSCAQDAAGETVNPQSSVRIEVTVSNHVGLGSELLKLATRNICLELNKGNYGATKETSFS